MLTQKEFKEFLTENQLIDGFNKSIIGVDFFEFSEGWYMLVSLLILDLIEAGWDKQLDQAKEKFGGLRFYTTNNDANLYKIIGEYEKLSIKTCEKCGKKGFIRYNAWIRTLCDYCFDNPS